MRTPKARFDGLPDHASAAHYVEIDADIPLRMHYADKRLNTATAGAAGCAL